MKIAEKYSELYDNEWTDTIDCTVEVKALYPQMKTEEIEEIIIRHLYQLVTVSIRFMMVTLTHSNQSVKNIKDISDHYKIIICSLSSMCLFRYCVSLMNDVGNAWCYINTGQYPDRYFPVKQFEDTKGIKVYLIQWALHVSEITFIRNDQNQII